MSGLLSKIEEKLGGSSKDADRNRLQKSPPESSGPGNTSDWGTRTTGNDSGAPESVRHPISTTSGPTGTAVDNNYSSTSATSRDVAPGTFAPPGGYSNTGVNEPTDRYQTGATQSKYDTPASTLPTGQHGTGIQPGSHTQNETSGFSSHETAPLQGMQGNSSSQAYALPTREHDAGLQQGSRYQGETSGVSSFATDPRATQDSHATGQTYAPPPGQPGAAIQPGSRYEDQSPVVSSLGPTSSGTRDGGTLNQEAGGLGKNTTTGVHSHPGGSDSISAGERHEEVTAKELRAAYDAGYRDALEHMKSGTHGAHGTHGMHGTHGTHGTHDTQPMSALETAPRSTQDSYATSQASALPTGQHGTGRQPGSSTLYPATGTQL